MLKPQIAYLITAYNNFKHLNHLVKALDDDNVNFFIHIDKKSIRHNLIKQENVTYIKSINVWWGGWSHMQAIINLMEVAVRTKCDYFALISGGDFPVRNKEYLYEKLKEGGDYISIKEGFPSEMKKSWVQNYYFDCFYRRKPNKPIWIKCLLKIEKWSALYFKKRKFPFAKVYFGSTWWVLNYQTVVFLLRFFKENKKTLNYFKSSFCSEEILIPSIIGNSNIRNIKGNLTYVDWSVHPGPAFISKKHLDFIWENEIFVNDYGLHSVFFARKFNDDSCAYIEYINKNKK